MMASWGVVRGKRNTVAYVLSTYPCYVSWQQLRLFIFHFFSFQPFSFIIFLHFIHFRCIAQWLDNSYV